MYRMYRMCRKWCITSVSLATDYPATCIVSNVITEARSFSETQKCKNENINTAYNLEAGRIEQVRIFTLLSRTGAVEIITFGRNTVG